jgi:diacylglycerol kinase (ATP)
MTIANSEILFIINPNSGSRRYNHLIRRIVEIDQGLTYIITKQNETVKQLFDENLDKYKVFVVVGGDGTVHDAARYLYNREDKILGVIPNGSGNGFAYELGFTRNINSLLRDIHAGETLKLDVLELNGQECINIAGLGFDSYVAHRFGKGKTRGFLTYVIITIRAIFKFRAINASIVVDNKTISGRYQMICFANNKQFGNYALIAPFAKPNDGIFDIVLIKPLPFYLYADFVAKMFLGRLRDSKYLKYIKSGEEIIVSADSGEYQIDGEPVMFDGPVKIRISDKFLKVIRTGRNKL